MDWAGTSAGEAQHAEISAIISENVERYCQSSASAVYLGAGLGRHAFDAGRLFSSVFAIELSFASAGLFGRLGAGPIRFAVDAWRGANSDSELLALHTAVRPAQPANVIYMVADASVLPLPDASVDTVVSIFFTDVVPASQLFTEARRVLRPGGKFVSLGPLWYHFQEKREQLTRTEMREMIGRYGFTLEPYERWFEMPHDERGGSRIVFRVWSFVATRV